MALFFIAGCSFFTLSSLLFLTGTGLQRLCSDLASPHYVLFAELLDNREVWDGKTAVGFFAEPLLLRLPLDVNASSLNVKVVWALK